MLPFQDTAHYTELGQSSPAMTATVVVLVGVVGFGSLVLVALGVALAAARRARAATLAEAGAENRRLVAGYAVLHGTVETGDGLPAVSVRIRQWGREYRAKALKHTWSELDRQVDARPFVLRLLSGERVKVVPGADVRLVAALRTAQAPGLAQVVPAGGALLPSPVRSRIAELLPGEKAYACGNLVVPATTAEAYRSPDDGFTLYPPPRGKMLLSTEKLEQRFARRARLHALWCAGCFAGLLVANVLVFGVFWLELLFGQVAVGRATRTTTWTTSGKHGPVSHYGVEADVPVDGRSLRLTSETNHAYFTSVQGDLARHAGVDVPFLVVPSHPSTFDLGTDPTLHGAVCFYSWFLLGGVAFTYLSVARRARPWYERRKVVDTGTGPLGYPDDLA